MDLTGLDDAFRAGNAATRPALCRLARPTRPARKTAPWSTAQPGGPRRSRRQRPRNRGAVAGFYRALATGSLLSPEQLAEAVTPHCAGPDRVFGDDNAWGLGFGISDDGYGMGGLGGNYGGTSTAGGYTVGFVTGSVGGYDRVDKLENTLRECLGAWADPQQRATRLRAAEAGSPLRLITGQHYPHGWRPRARCLREQFKLADPDREATTGADHKP